MICGFAYALVISAPVEGGLGRVSCEFLSSNSPRQTNQAEYAERTCGKWQEDSPVSPFLGSGKGQKGSSFDAGIG